MGKKLAALFLALASWLVDCEVVGTYANDTGALYILELQDTIDEAFDDLMNNTRYADYSPTDGEEFDFIVVGGGSAGSVVAGRLSENPSWRVLLLEAGGDPTVTSEIPYLLGSLSDSLDWHYSTEPDPENCLGSVDGRCPLPRGKALGGCSTVNGMVYNRGHPEDYNGWEKLGNPGWGFKDMLPYFKKSEDMRLETVLRGGNSSEYHSVGGPLKIESFPFKMKLSNTLIAASKQLGYKSRYDINSQFDDGLFPIQATLDKTRRCITAKAFLLNTQERENLKISKNSLVMKILLTDMNKAEGVTFEKKGNTFTVKASKEIILSAGSVNSPQILMLSGIGPEEHLKELGIEVKQNLKVGYNLQDHPIFQGFIVTVDISDPIEDEISAMFDFLVERKGYFTSKPRLPYYSVITSSEAAYRNIQIDYQQLDKTQSSSSSPSVFSISMFQDEIRRSIQSIITGKMTFIGAPWISRPKSRGRILLSNTNIRTPPIIQMGYFHNEDDLEEFLEAIAFLNKLVSTQSFKDSGARVERVDIPACREYEFQTDDYWRCAIRNMVSTNNHACGTCRIGPRGDPGAVVDPGLQVVGVAGLRVVDASVMPTVTSGNTNAPTIAIAEKAADLIKHDWHDAPLTDHFVYLATKEEPDQAHDPQVQ